MTSVSLVDSSSCVSVIRQGSEMPSRASGADGKAEDLPRCKVTIAIYI